MLPVLKLTWVLQPMASAQRLPMELEPTQAGRKDGRRMHENRFGSYKSTDEKSKRLWPDTSGGQFLHLGKRKEKEKEILRDAPNGLIFEEKHNKMTHRVYLMGDQNPRTGRAFLR